MATEEAYNDQPYIGAVSSFAVPGLFPNFHCAATLLRMEKSELRADLVEDGTVAIEEFYRLLDDVDAHLLSRSSAITTATTHEKFIVEVEGLDGSGKTTLVTKLAEALPGSVIATKTPSASLKAVRPLWDHRGGILARAFYTVSNYVLEYEIAKCEKDLIVVDRWYASTCAYTVAHPKDAAGREENTATQISDLADDVFEWPDDLYLKPQVLLVLQIDPEVRRKRVENRAVSGGGASRFNPWDDRLAKDRDLGTRILEALGRIKGPKEVHSVNANLSIVEMVNDALALVKPALQRHSNPQDYFASKPLDWWRYMSQQLRLCDESGKRSHHALWNLQVSYAGDDSGRGPPVLKTVGLDRIDSDCVYYWTAGSAFPSRHPVWASILWTGGEYPTDAQWRAEGFLVRVTPEECALRGFSAPPSLTAHVMACCENKGANGCESQRPSRPDNYDGSVREARQSPNSASICMIRFVPIRIEVLRGGPSTRVPGFPQRWEWSRDADSSSMWAVIQGMRTADNWTVRSILPFPGTLSPTQTMIFRDMTIAIIGTHGSGKSTIGTKLANLLGCRFDPELGTILRDQDSLVTSGHLHGNGSSTKTSQDEQQDWDDRIHSAEVKRDEESSGNRVVETWHLGNKSWYKLREKQLDHRRLKRYTSAVANHRETSLVLMVQLALETPSIMVRRRKQHATMRERLPMENEEEECKELHQALQGERTNFHIVARELGIPLLQISNGHDGKDAIEQTLRAILSFMQQHYHRQVVTAPKSSIKRQRMSSNNF